MRGLIEEISFNFRALKALIFPQRCLICGEILEEFENYLCIKCFAEMPLTFFWDWRENPIERLLWDKVGITSAFSLFFYQDTNNYSLITQHVKYHGWLSLGEKMGDYLARCYISSNQKKTIDAIVPVPLHWKRYWARGYNQAETIGQGIAKRLNVPILNLLSRTKHTQSQTTLTMDNKSKNVMNAFKIRKEPSLMAKKQGITHVLLIDDVCTTGATLSACATPLLEYGFEVSVATVAFVGEL